MKIVASEQRSRFTVNAAASVLKRLYFLQRELVLMQAGWLPGSGSLDVKLALAEALWQDALVAGQLRQRVLELRYPERRIEPDEDASLLAAFRLLRDAPDDASFLAAFHGILKPWMETLFRAYLDQTDHLDDRPTLRILQQALLDLSQQRDAARPLLLTPACDQQWLAAVRGLITSLDPGVLATEKTIRVSPQPQPLPGGRPFAVARTAVRDSRFARPVFAWPDRLDPRRGAGTGMELQVRAAVHHLNEVWATEMAAAVLYDLAGEAPHEFLEDAARWCFDESRHCRMGQVRLAEFGFQPTQIPLDSFSYDAGAGLDPIARLGIIFYFETTYIHTKSERTKIFAEFGDRVSSHDMDYDWADELIHTYYGNKWLKFFLEKNQDARTPKDVKKIAESAVEAIRSRATEEDRRETEFHYETILSRAVELAGG